MNDLKKQKSSIIDDQNKSIFEFDVMLEIISNILKKDENEKCICIPTSSYVDNKGVFYENEIVPGLEVPTNSDGKIPLQTIIMKLKQCGYPLCGALISVFIKDAHEYMLIGSDPIDKNIFLDQELFSSKLVKIRAVCYIEEKLIGKNVNLYSSGALRLSRSSSGLDKKKSKRTKERKIGYIIEKVNTWRKLYNGFYDENSMFSKYSLDEAAKIIGISKKSLDDYLLQLRLGRKYGFDFNSNKNSKVGILRSFVKKHRNFKD